MAEFRVERRAAPEDVRRILSALPNWFGIPEANEHYVQSAAVLPSYVALDSDGLVVGIALVKRDYPESADLNLIAVDPAHHRSGVGSALVTAIEADLAADGVRLFQVHTVGPSYDDEYYALTREFYRALGFLRLREFPRLEWDGPTLVLVKPLIDPRGGSD